MSRGSYGYVGRRSGGAAWQWIIIGAVLGFGCSVVLVLAGLAGGLINLDGAVANLPTSTPYIITATPAPVTPTIAPTEAPVTDAPTQGIMIEAPTATPTIDATFLTLQPAATATSSSLAGDSTQAALSAGTTPNTVNTNSSNGSGLSQLLSFASETVPVSGGTFIMGTNPSEVAAAVQDCVNGYGGDPGNCQLSYGDDSYPEHSVTISPFSMETTEVSYSQFMAFMNALGPGSHRNGCGGQACMQTRLESETSNIQFDSNTYSVLLSINDFPMANVTWYGAKAYCEAIGRRLPTEAEWEYAARGGSADRIYPWGNLWDGTLASTKRPVDGSQPGPVSVISFTAGQTLDTGILNMAGNVAEWTSDWYDPRFYGRPEATLTDPMGPVSGTQKVVRGGSWDAMPFFSRTVHRQSQDPNLPTAWIGFRCVEDANSQVPTNNPLGSNTQPENSPLDLALPTTNPLDGSSNTTNSQPTLPPAPTQSGPLPTLVPGG